jgi:putative transposase
MKKKRFSVEQMVAVLKQAELGMPVAEVIRKVGISEQTFYRWKKQYVGMEADQARQMKQLQEENSRLKQLVADLSLDKTMLQDVLRKSSEVLGAPSDGRLFTRPVSGERAACQPGSSDGARHVSLSESSGTMDGVARADTRDRTEQSALRGTARSACC